MKDKSSLDILFFAEDPGAANYLVDMPLRCRAEGFRYKVIAESLARGFFRETEVPYEDVEGSDDPGDLLRRFNSRLLVVGTSENPRSLGLKLVETARKKGMATLGVVDAFMNAAYRFRGLGEDPLRFAPEWIAVPDAWTQSAFLDLGHPSDRVVICGHPRYDAVRQRSLQLRGRGREAVRRRIFPDAGPEKPIVLFASELSEGLNPSQFTWSEEYGLSGWGESRLRTPIVLEEFLEAVDHLPDRPYLALRLHPKEHRGDFTAYLDRFDRVSQREPVLEVIFASDFVVGLTSTLLLEACLVGRPTLSILPREAEREWLPTVRAGLTRCATTREELQALLPGFLSGLETKHVPKCDDVFVFGALGRVITLIKSILGIPVPIPAGSAKKTRHRDGAIPCT
ncbi:MAG: hypothetical protein JW821_06930 [Deltaproteobacteria bacterium]|nr:hypothetical protein [Deltaproteobacteria bacterium]